MLSESLTNCCAVAFAGTQPPSCRDTSSLVQVRPTTGQFLGCLIMLCTGIAMSSRNAFCSLLCKTALTQCWKQWYFSFPAGFQLCSIHGRTNSVGLAKPTRSPFSKPNCLSLASHGWVAELEEADPTAKWSQLLPEPWKVQVLLTYSRYMHTLSPHLDCAVSVVCRYQRKESLS